MSIPDFMLEALPAGKEPPDERAPEPKAGETADRPKREPVPFVAGVFENMPAEQYFAVEAMSQSGAKEMLRSPMHYRYARDNPPEPTPAMRFGTAVHTGVLEPELFDSTVVAMPAVDRRTAAGKAAYAAFMAAAAGKVVLSQADFDRARRCIDAVGRHPAAKALLAGATVETSLFWIDAKYHVPCKARIDARNHGGLIDLKTTTDASRDEWPRAAAGWGYHLQAANYFSGCEHLLDATPEFFAHVVVESEAPHGVAVYAMPGNAIMAGAARMNEALRLYADAMRSGYWTGYPSTIETFTFPRWATRADF